VWHKCHTPTIGQRGALVSTSSGGYPTTGAAGKTHQRPRQGQGDGIGQEASGRNRRRATMRIRLTIEYDTDGNPLNREVNDWADGNITYQDLYNLMNDDYQAGKNTDIVIRFEDIT
jgi:hypothetical protein